MRLDGKPQPPRVRASRPRPRGRPKYHEPAKLRDAWLLVQEAMAREGISVNRACAKYELRWIMGGHGGAKLEYSVAKDTLRSRYYEACRMLKREKQEHAEFVRALRRVGAR